MKITSFKETAKSGIKVFKPIQYLVIDGVCPANQISACKLRARIVNSESGRVDEIIPLLSVDVLGEITSMNEGFYIYHRASNGDGSVDAFKINVMLHPTSAVYLSNDKYLEIDIEGLSDSVTTNVYGLEMPVIDKDFICRYNKFYMSAGELQKTFMVGDNENLILPLTDFEEVQLQHKNGTSCTYTTEELKAIMMLKNDVVSVPCPNVTRMVYGTEGASLAGAGNAVYANAALHFGYKSMFGLDVSSVDNFSIRRSNASSAFEFVLIDAIKE